MRGFGAFKAARAPFVALVLGLLSVPGVAFSSTKHTAPSAKEPFAYNTSGIVSVGANPASVAGPAVLQFQGVSGASFDPKSSQAINLGQFVVVPSSIASGQATAYNGTPFEVEIQTPEFNKTSHVPLFSNIFPAFGRRFDLKTVVENSLLLKGHLNGTVGANGQANVTTTVDSIKLGSMEAQTQDHVTHFAFPIRFSQLKLPTSWVMSASPTLTTTPTITTTPTTTTTGTVAPSPAGQMFTVPATTGTIAPSPAAEMMTTTPTPTPEPSTIVFFATVFGGLALIRRRLSAR